MADAKQALKDLVGALLGISTFAPPTMPGPELGDPLVNSAREALGGRLEPIPAVRLRWYPPDIERAQLRAQNGDMTMIGQLNESMGLDGVYRGLSDARASVVNFPRRIYGSEEVRAVLLSKNNSDRDVYDEMIPATEAKLMVKDEMNCGVAIGEMVPVQGRDFPVLVRRYVQNLFYLWSKNQWYYRSIVGLIPITPGITDEDGNGWVLHIGGGRLSPWNSGLWNTCGRSYINKTQTIFARQSYEMKHSHPARVAEAALGATEQERKGLLEGIIRWALNAAFVLPVGYTLKLVESNGRGIEVYEHSLKTANEEMATALCGSSVMLQGTAGFANMDAFETVNINLLRSTASGWDHCVNTQILPAFIARRWGTDALKNSTTIETDVTAPSDRKVEADTLVSLSTAITGLVSAIASAQIAAGVDKPIALDIHELVARFGLPIKTDGVPKPKPPEIQGPSGGGNPPGKKKEPPPAGALALLAAHVDPLAEYREEDHPRDERGRFSSHGSTDAANASKVAHKKGDRESHKKASEAHAEAKEKHEAEAQRRDALSRKRSLPKEDRARHAKAAERHRAAASEHGKLAKYHAAAAPKLEDLGIAHSLSEADRKPVEKAIQKGGYGHYLADHPLESVREHDAIGPNGERQSSNGVYARPHEKGALPFISLKSMPDVEMTHMRAEKNWTKLGGRKPIGSPEVFSLSTLATTPEEMRERTMVHELGHHIHLDRNNPLSKETNRTIKDAYAARVESDEATKSQKRKPGAWVASAYAMSDHKEWFSETHAAYVYHPKELKKHDPEAFKLMARVRKERGIE